MELFQIPAREKIGRAKSVPAEEYAAGLSSRSSQEMEQEIAAICCPGR